MCMKNLEPYEHDGDIVAYKAVFKLKDGTLVSPKTHLARDIETDYVYQSGNNSADDPERGLCSFVNREDAIRMAYGCSGFGGVTRTEQVESVIVLQVTIPADDQTRRGNHGEIKENGYVSQTLIIDIRVLEEYPMVRDHKRAGDYLKYLWQWEDDAIPSV